MLAAARDSTNPNDFALVCLLGLLGLRIFETTSLDISDLGEEHGHRVVRVVGKGHKVVLVPMPPAVAALSTAPSPVATSDRSCSTATAAGWTATPQPDVCTGCKKLRE